MRDNNFFEEWFRIQSMWDDRSSDAQLLRSYRVCLRRMNGRSRIDCGRMANSLYSMRGSARQFDTRDKKVLFVIETIGHLADLSQHERMTQ